MLKYGVINIFWNFRQIVERTEQEMLNQEMIARLWQQIVEVMERERQELHAIIEARKINDKENENEK